MHNRILAVLLAVMLMFAVAVNASAAEEGMMPMPDLSMKGSLTFTMDVDGQLLDSGNLNLYYVAGLVQTSERRYDFRLVDELEAVGATLDTDDLYDAAQAKRLLADAHEALDRHLSLPIEDGKVRFDNLNTGLYLVWQDADDASDGYDAIAPFLISVPKWQNGIYALDVDANPKVPFVTEPPPPDTPPPPPHTPPPPPELPHTGQLNWPIPVMAISGTVLLIVGWILCAGRKRCHGEK